MGWCTSSPVVVVVPRKKQEKWSEVRMLGERESKSR